MKRFRIVTVDQTYLVESDAEDTTDLLFGLDRTTLGDIIFVAVGQSRPALLNVANIIAVEEEGLSQ